MMKILLILNGFRIRTNQGYVKVEFSAPIPPNKPEAEAPVSNDSSMSEYYRFA